VQSARGCGTVGEEELPKVDEDYMVVRRIPALTRSMTVSEKEQSPAAGAGAGAATDHKSSSLGVLGAAVMAAVSGVVAKLPVVRVRTPIVFTTTASGGVSTTKVTVDPSAGSENSAFAALWSEVRCTGGVLDFVPDKSMVNGQFVISYDPNSAASLSSVVAGCALAQHRLYSIGFTSANGECASTMQNAKGLSFSFRVPKGSATGFSGSDQWTATSGNGDYGTLKVYIPNGAGTMGPISGVLYLDLEYRSRT